MRVYHSLVFDEVLEGTGILYTPPRFNLQLAETEHVELYIHCESASGTSPTLTVQIEESADEIRWRDRNTLPEINAAALSTTAATTLVARDSGSLFGSGFSRLRIQLGGTNPKAVAKIFATGLHRNAATTPLTILGASVLQWCRADLGVTLNGSTVSAWADQSGNGKSYSQGTAAKQPAWSATSGPNGTPAITFDGSDDELIAASLTLPAPGTTPTFIWIIGYQHTWAAAGDSFVAADSGVNVMLIQQGNGASPQLALFNTSPRCLNGGMPLDTWRRIEAYFSNSAADYLKLGSTTVADGLTAGNSSGTGRRLCGDSSGRCLDGRVAEIVYANALPTADQRAALDVYASSRYGAGLT